jgi:hypothetical protein
MSRTERLTGAGRDAMFPRLLGNGACFSYTDAVSCLAEQAPSRQMFGGFSCLR